MVIKIIGFLLYISAVHAWLDKEVDIEQLMEGVDPSTVKEVVGSHPRVMSTA